MVPLNLLIFALETAVTTLTCVVEMGSWDGYTAEQMNGLYALYLPYLALGKSVPLSLSPSISLSAISVVVSTVYCTWTVPKENATSRPRSRVDSVWI